MERRFLLAVALMVAVLVGPSLFMKRTSAARTAAADSLAARQATPAGATPAAATPAAPAPQGAAVSAPPQGAAAPASATAVFDTVSLGRRDAIYRFSSGGATLEQATFPQLKNYRQGEHPPVALVRPGDRMLQSRLVFGADTVRFDAAPFSIERRGESFKMSAQAGTLTQSVVVSEVPGQPFLLDVQGEVAGLEGRGALLIVGMGSGFANAEADSLDNYRHYGVAVRKDSPRSFDFKSVDSGATQTLDGPFDWVAVKSKYFIGALLSADSAKPQIGGALLVGGARTGRGIAPTLQTSVTMPVGTDGRYHYQIYLGPVMQRTLSPLGRDLDRASPYGWIFKPIVMPVASFITRLFLWIHVHIGLSYGLVLVVFGIMVRLLLWPLNQRAMKSQVAMMAVQPILKDLQTRYKNDPQKLQQETMRIYKEHHVNPLGGCLPLLLPMPILLALFFVFANTIELRGAPFLWLPDLSLRDPLFITPVVMGLSMFGLSKLSQAGMPPNPQAKMMTIVMPIMMTVLFFNFASGLNLYYSVSNLVSLPQQYLINRARQAEMVRRQVGGGAKT